MYEDILGRETLVQAKMKQTRAYWDGRRDEQPLGDPPDDSCWDLVHHAVKEMKRCRDEWGFYPISPASFNR